MIKTDVTIAICWVWHKIGCRIDGNHRVLTRITAMDHLDHLGIPVFRQSMMTVYLQLVSLTSVVPLDH